MIDNTSIARIPLNGRLNINGLLALAPGIQNAGAQDQVPYYGLATEYLPPDAIQELTVITSGAGAEFGKPNQIVVVTKGGTDQWHGHALEFNRNRVMAAKNFFATQLPKPAYNRNELQPVSPVR